MEFKGNGVFNSGDCAIAKVATNNIASNSILKVGPPKSKGTAQPSMEVHKFGRSTEYSVGRVSSVDSDVTLEFSTGSYNFRKQIIIQGVNNQVFAEDGDSGALVLERGSQKAVGLLFGVGIDSAGTAHALANHIDDVLKALKVTLVLINESESPYESACTCLPQFLAFRFFKARLRPPAPVLEDPP